MLTALSKTSGLSKPPALLPIDGVTCSWFVFLAFVGIFLLRSISVEKNGIDNKAMDENTFGGSTKL